MKKKRCKNKLCFTKLQKGNTGVGKIPAMWTILKLIHVEVTDENICLRMEQKIKLYPKSGTKLRIVFEKYFFFYNCVILFSSFTDIMSESVIILQIMALSTLGLILWKVRSLSPGPVFPTSKNLTINWKCLGLQCSSQKFLLEGQIGPYHPFFWARYFKKGPMYQYLSNMQKRGNGWKVEEMKRQFIWSWHGAAFFIHRRGNIW